MGIFTIKNLKNTKMDEIGPWEEHVSFKNTKAIEKYDLSNEKKHDRMKNLKK
jgi:hypothetical protein